LGGLARGVVSGRALDSSRDDKMAKGVEREGWSAAENKLGQRTFELGLDSGKKKKRLGDVRERTKVP